MTSYSEVIESFLSLIEEDEDFFNYYQMSEDEAMELARHRAEKYMEEAVNIITTKCQPQIDFGKRSVVDGEPCFAFELNSTEKLLIPSLMYEQYLNRDMAKIKLKEVNYTSSELTVFDPSNARKTFMQIYEAVAAKNAQLLDDYKNTDRETGKFRTFDVAQYDTE